MAAKAQLKKDFHTSNLCQRVSCIWLLGLQPLTKRHKYQCNCIGSLSDWRQLWVCYVPPHTLWDCKGTSTWFVLSVIFEVVCEPLKHQEVLWQANFASHSLEWLYLVALLHIGYLFCCSLTYSVFLNTRWTLPLINYCDISTCQILTIRLPFHTT